MELWTAYEGVTIDGAFPLNKLVAPEGRSAFFSTANAKGESVFIRLIECHFDEDEILARWRGIQALGHPNFLKIDRFGKLELDNTTVAYAVFERTETDLGQVLRQGCLSLNDTIQLAESLCSALETLHAHGFVHEHIEPRNIFAVGETVKLRSDCIRETPEGEAGEKARHRDIRDMAIVLLQALTQRQTPDVYAISALPAPFDEIVRHAAMGTWGFAQIRTALEKSIKKPWTPVSGPAVNGTPRKPAPVQQAAAPTPPRPASSAPASTPKPQAARPVQEKLFSAATTAQPRTARQLPLSFTEMAREIPLRSKWIGAAALLLIVLLIGWFSFRSGANKQERVAQAASPAPIQPAAKHPHIAAATPRPNIPQPQASPVATAGHPQWRVVAFTYNRKDQAAKKASSLSQKHPDLRPEIFSPTGRAPFLVTIGGVLNKDDAYALAHRARSYGLPRDTYAQNYR